uniref:Uncharacterized protein n=1 Tax=Fagus sylvatica TaxID=28930 RepID=A0A2N9I4G5_FAGSY
MMSGHGGPDLGGEDLEVKVTVGDKGSLVVVVDILVAGGGGGGGYSGGGGGGYPGGGGPDSHHHINEIISIPTS